MGCSLGRVGSGWVRSCRVGSGRGSGWAGWGRAGSDQVGLGWVGAGRVRLGRFRSCRGLRRAGLGWFGLGRPITNAEMDGQEKISQVRLRSSLLEGKLTAFRSSLPRRSNHHSSDLKTNYPRKFSHLKVNTSRYTPSLLPNLFVACGLLPAPTRPVSWVGMLCHVTRGIDRWQIMYDSFPCFS